LRRSCVNFLFKRERGTTLVEVVIVVFISSIVISGLVKAYTDSIEIMNRGTDQMAMRSEADAAFEIMAKLFRFSNYVTTNGGINQPTHFLTVRGYSGDGEFYYYSQDNSFRWNDFTGDVGRFNRRLIPLFDYTNGPMDTPYIEVEDVSFTPIDPRTPTDPSTSGYLAIRVDMKLRAPSGDSLMISRSFAKMNPKSSS